MKSSIKWLCDSFTEAAALVVAIGWVVAVVAFCIYNFASAPLLFTAIITVILAIILAMME